MDDEHRRRFGRDRIERGAAANAIAADEVDDPEAATFYSCVARNPVGVEFTAADDGKTATYFARWANNSGEVGPWSQPVHMRIAA